MKCFLLSTVLCFAVCIAGCNRCPLEYGGTRNLEQAQKNWITYAGTQVIFKNQNDSIALFNYSSVKDTLLRLLNECGSDCKGCDVDGTFYDVQYSSFTLTSDSLPFDFKIGVYAGYSGGHSPSPPNFLAGSDSLGVKYLGLSDDANFVPPYSEQIILNGTTFDDVYESDNYSDTSARFYVSKQLGIVGFTTHEGDTWSLQQ